MRPYKVNRNNKKLKQLIFWSHPWSCLVEYRSWDLSFSDWISEQNISNYQVFIIFLQQTHTDQIEIESVSLTE